MYMFRILLPKAGMVYPPGKSKGLDHDWRDKRVIIAIRYEVPLVTDTHQMAKATKKAVDELLAAMFTAALEPTILVILTEKGNLIDYLSEVRKSIPWAMKMGEPTFIKFFEFLVDARLAWKASPRPPFDTAEHCLLAKAIDEFQVRAGPWNNAEIQLLDVVGGFASDEDVVEDDDQDVDEVTKEFEAMDIDEEDESEQEEQEEHEALNAGAEADQMEVDE